MVALAPNTTPHTPNRHAADVNDNALRSIDDAVAKRVDRDADGDFVDADCSYWYQLSDSQVSVGVVLDWVGNVYERIEYDAYGVARHRWGAHTNNATLTLTPSNDRQDSPPSPQHP